jgi:hypothetical protein
MVAILAAVLTDGLPAVDAACAHAMSEGVHSSDVIIRACTGGSTGTPHASLRQPPHGHSATRGSLLWTTGTSRTCAGSILDADRGSIFNAD